MSEQAPPVRSTNPHPPFRCKLCLVEVLDRDGAGSGYLCDRCHLTWTTRQYAVWSEQAKTPLTPKPPPFGFSRAETAAFIASIAVFAIVMVGVVAAWLATTGVMCR